ncbi:MAG TPA: hypothetical protein PLX89_11745 [Verrucomicrobiota bacterium]|nr:hypothetical protein [Verrucomicrobiota bacterium]
MPLLSSVGVDGPALRFVIVTALGCSVLFGIVPALRAAMDGGAEKQVMMEL